MGDDDPDALVWDKLTRTTLDGIAVPPLGTPDLARGPGDQRPPDPRRGLGHPRPHGDARATRGQRGGARRPRRRRHLAVAARRTPSTDLDAARSTGSSSTSPRSCSTPRATRSATARGLPRPTRRRSSCTRAPTSACRRPRPPPRWPRWPRRGRDAGLRRRRHRGPRPRRLRRPGARLVDGRRRRLPARASPTAGLDARRGGGAGRVPLRRHRRAVHDDRQAARRPPALGAGARAQRRRARPSSASTRSPAGR